MSNPASSFAGIAQAAVEQNKSDPTEGDYQPEPSPSSPGWHPSRDQALTSPTSDVPPSITIPSSPGVPGVSAPSAPRSPPSTGDGSPARPSATSAQSMPFMSSTLLGPPLGSKPQHPNPPTSNSTAVNGDYLTAHQNGNGNGRIPEEEVDEATELSSTANERAHRPADVASSQTNGQHAEIKAKDFGANSAAPISVKTLAGGGKGVRNKSFVSLMGQGRTTKGKDRELTDSPDETPSTSSTGMPSTGGFFPIHLPSNPHISVRQHQPGQAVRSQTLPLPTSPLQRSNSLPHPTKSASGGGPRPIAGAREGGTPTGDGGGAKQKWTNLKQKLQRKQTGAVPLVEEKMAAPMRLTDELLGGALGVVMLKMDIDRDEKGRKRVPVFLHHVKSVPSAARYVDFLERFALADLAFILLTQVQGVGLDRRIWQPPGVQDRGQSD